MILTVPTSEAMHELGLRIAGMLRPGDLLVLSGDLGAGKTTLTRGIGEGLKVRGPITSPTFVISRVHPSLCGGPALVHVDAYRLGGFAELDDLDLEASVEDSVTVVEWGAGLAEGLAGDRLEIVISRARGSGDTAADGISGETAGAVPDPAEVRTVSLHPVGDHWADLTGPAGFPV